MAYEHDELNTRRERRAAYQQQRQRRQRRQMIRLLIIAAVLVVLIVVGAVLLGQYISNAPTQPTVPETTAPPQTTAPMQAEPTEPETIIHLVAGGDLNITDLSVGAGFNGSGYSYTDVFKDVAPVLATADLAMLNFEGNICGSPYGSQTTSAPKELLEALAAAGVDALQMANSCTINNGLLGLSASLDAVQAAGMEPLGAYANAEQAREGKGYTMLDIRGVRVALVAFTKGMGNLGLPFGSESCVNLLYTDYASSYQKINTEGISAVLSAVAEQEPDVTIAMLHWGSEYNDMISKSQGRIVELLQQQGVDIIIGSHPHYVQQVVFDENNDTVVAYSLGDFFGDATTNGTQYSILLELEITKDNRSGEVDITGCQAIPIYTLTQERDQQPMRVVRIREALLDYENDHIFKVSATTYSNMKNALDRIQDRITPDED